MNGRYDSDDLDEGREGPVAAADREISLGTGAMLGIFLALVLVCGAFFGFGYSMGHKAAPVGAPVAAVGDADTGPAAGRGGMKPMPGSSGVSGAPEVVVKPSAGSVPVPAVSKKVTAAAPADVEGEVPAPVVRTTPKPYVAPPSAAPLVEPAADGIQPPSSAAVPPGAAGAAPIYVQISAVSHQEDAQLLTTALKRRGYDVTVRHTPQDQLLHVQVGPFATKKDADAMRQRLSADGYNAILK